MGGVQRLVCCGGGPMVTPYPDCPNAADHTPCPGGYVAWHAWAAATAKTHTQRVCDGCGRWNIWVPKRVMS